MITSNKQLIAATKKLEQLSYSIALPAKTDVPIKIYNASRLQLRELIDDIKTEISDYNFLRSCELSDIKIHSLGDLMLVPIRYRIAAHMSIDSFSRKVGVSARQIARYENECYQNTNSRTLQKILAKLDIQLEGKVA